MDYNKIIDIIKSTEDLLANKRLAADVNKKGDADYVTAVDLSVQSYIKERLGKLHPEIGFVGEEGENNFKPGCAQWILDPVDGTTNLIHGFEYSAVSLGLCDGKEIVFGVIFNPFTKELAYAIKGKGAFLNGERIFCSNADKIENALALVEFNPYYKKEADDSFDMMKNVFNNCQDIRCLGSAAMELLYVACGRADVSVGRHLKPWDYAGGAIIVTEAGGRITTTDGADVPFDKDCHLLATNGNLHNQMLKIIKNQ